MGRALNQAGAVVQELISRPFKRHSPVRTMVAVNEYLSLSTHGQQFQPIYFKASAVRFSHVYRVAKEFHPGFPSGD